MEIVKHLNRFAHGVDEESAGIELNSTIRNLIQLMERIVERRQATLQVRYSPDEIRIQASPFRMQQILFRCLQAWLDDAAPGSNFDISVERTGRSARIDVRGPRAGDGAAWKETIERLVETAAAGSFRITADLEPERSTIRIEHLSNEDRP